MKKQAIDKLPTRPAVSSTVWFGIISFLRELRWCRKAPESSPVSATCREKSSPQGTEDQSLFDKLHAKGAVLGRKSFQSFHGFPRPEDLFEGLPILEIRYLELKEHPYDIRCEVIQGDVIWPNMEESNERQV